MSQSNSDWWPNQLNLKILHQHSPLSNPMGESFDYAEAFKSLDLDAVKRDLYALMTESQDWWPADYGHLRRSLHPHDLACCRHLPDRGRSGRRGHRKPTLRAPSTAGPTTATSTRPDRLLWPIKKKYGNKLSWADLLILAGNCALESMGFKTFGFGGRPGGCLGTRGRYLLGRRDRVAGDQRQAEQPVFRRP